MKSPHEPNRFNGEQRSDLKFSSFREACETINRAYPGEHERSEHLDPESRETYYRVRVVQDEHDPILLHIREEDDGWEIVLHEPRVPMVSRFVPFPVDALPSRLRTFVVRGAEAIGCDASYLALPALTAAAAAIGNTRRLRLKLGWEAPSIIWAAIVGESGTAKTPAFKLVMRPIRERQIKEFELHAQALDAYEDDLARYEKELAEWKRGKDDCESPPTKPIEPEAFRCIVNDTTIEALAPLLRANPRGLVLGCDELAGWFGAFDRYSGGKGGADVAHWLSTHNGEEITIDRKTGKPRTIHVPIASVSVCGGIQPAILDRCLGREYRDSGLAARLLLTCPPRKAKRWTEADIAPEDEKAFESLFDSLFELEFRVDENQQPKPKVIELTPDAKAAWREYYDRHADEQVDLSGDLAAAWSKLEEYAARFALVIHYVRWAAGEIECEDHVDAVSMAAGIRLADWFKNEARRVYAMLCETEESSEERRLVEWIERKGGTVTAREVQNGNRRYETAEEAEAALKHLEQAGHGAWHEIPPGPKGGRPKREFRLYTRSTSTQPTKPRETSGCVDVDSVDAPETPAVESDWDEI